ncbi:interleukin-18 receptor 1-like isoform X2 [Heterodontus francisci]|uniref:interleukin-18 receptor 1-like isoform X2 n=1 Tax=Heterodontus francisci TaxID=7792 RepID=UPI00355C9EAA
MKSQITDKWTLAKQELYDTESTKEKDKDSEELKVVEPNLDVAMDVKYLTLITVVCFLGRIQGDLIKCPPYESTTVVALEGEHARLRCKLCNASTSLVLTDLQTHGFNITWFKDTSEDGHVELLRKTGRITFEGTLLGFWPAFMNDTGRYSCSVLNRTYNITSAGITLNVHRNKGLCRGNVYLFSQRVGSSIMLPCPKLEDYSSKDENIIWLKDCKDNVHIGTTYTIQKVEEKSAGYYSCVLPLENDGVEYNVTRILKLKVKEYVEPFKPKLIYPVEEQIELELGEKREIECKAVVGYKVDNFCLLYWIFNNSFFNISGNDAVYESPERIVIEDNRTSMISLLVFTRIKAEYLNKNFTCFLNCPDTNQIGYIILLEKGKSDTGPIVLLLIMTVAVFIIVAVVFGRYKIYFALCFRDFTSRDETLQDSKEYDAYVLLLKSDETLLSAKEEAFALELLPAILEQKFGYRLCILERDVLPGGASTNDILSYINKCRRLIIILCAECMADDSPMYELMTGLHQALVERLIKPILIEYNPVRDITFLPLSLQLILRTNRRVKWKSASLSQNSYFWKKMRYLMPAKHIKASDNSPNGRTIL